MGTSKICGCCGERPTFNLNKCNHCLEREDEEGMRHNAPSTRQFHYGRGRSVRHTRYRGPRRMAS
jgi:hypothetical protein